MEANCQRCHENLRDSDLYCPVCGLPQLTYVASEPPPLPLGDEALPPHGDLAGLVNGIVWRPALQAALMLAIPAGVLCFSLFPLGLLWMMCAAAWAVSLYARRTRPARLSAGIGIRIGLVTGLFASWLTVGLFGIGLWVLRFVLHQGGQWDAMWQQQIERGIASNEIVAQMGAANAQSAQIAQSTRNIMLSVDGRAGLPLSGLVVLAMFVIFFAIIGGVVGARFLAQPRPRA